MSMQQEEYISKILDFFEEIIKDIYLTKLKDSLTRIPPGKISLNPKIIHLKVPEEEISKKIKNVIPPLTCMLLDDRQDLFNNVIAFMLAMSGNLLEKICRELQNFPLNNRMLIYASICEMKFGDYWYKFNKSDSYEELYKKSLPGLEDTASGFLSQYWNAFIGNKIIFSRQMTEKNDLLKLDKPLIKKQLKLTDLAKPAPGLIDSQQLSFHFLIKIAYQCRHFLDQADFFINTLENNFAKELFFYHLINEGCIEYDLNEIKDFIELPGIFTSFRIVPLFGEYDIEINSSLVTLLVKTLENEEQELFCSMFEVLQYLCQTGNPASFNRIQKAIGKSFGSFKKFMKKTGLSFKELLIDRYNMSSPAALGRTGTFITYSRMAKDYAKYPGDFKNIAEALEIHPDKKIEDIDQLEPGDCPYKYPLNPNDQALMLIYLYRYEKVFINKFHSKISDTFFWMLDIFMENSGCTSRLDKEKVIIYFEQSEKYEENVKFFIKQKLDLKGAKDRRKLNRMEELSYYWLYLVSYTLKEETGLYRNCLLFLYTIDPFRFLDQIVEIHTLVFTKEQEAGSTDNISPGYLLLNVFRLAGFRKHKLLAPFIYQVPLYTIKNFPRLKKLFNNFRDIKSFEIETYLFEGWRKERKNLLNSFQYLVKNFLLQNSPEEDIEYSRLIKLVENHNPAIWQKLYQREKEQFEKLCCDSDDEMLANTLLSPYIYSAYMAQEKPDLEKLGKIFIYKFNHDFSDQFNAEKLNDYTSYLKGNYTLKDITFPENKKIIAPSSSWPDTDLYWLFHFRDEDDLFKRVLVLYVFITTREKPLLSLINRFYKKNNTSVEELVHFFLDLGIKNTILKNRFNSAPLLKGLSEAHNDWYPLFNFKEYLWSWESMQSKDEQIEEAVSLFGKHIDYNYKKKFKKSLYGYHFINYPLFESPNEIICRQQEQLKISMAGLAEILTKMILEGAVSGPEIIIAFLLATEQNPLDLLCTELQIFPLTQRALVYCKILDMNFSRFNKEFSAKRSMEVFRKKNLPGFQLTIQNILRKGWANYFDESIFMYNSTVNPRYAESHEKALIKKLTYNDYKRHDQGSTMARTVNLGFMIYVAKKCQPYVDDAKQMISLLAKYFPVQLFLCYLSYDGVKENNLAKIEKYLTDSNLDSNYREIKIRSKEIIFFTSDYKNLLLGLLELSERKLYIRMCIILTSVNIEDENHNPYADKLSPAEKSYYIIKTFADQTDFSFKNIIKEEVYNNRSPSAFHGIYFFRKMKVDYALFPAEFRELAESIDFEQTNMHDYWDFNIGDQAMMLIYMIKYQNITGKHYLEEIKQSILVMMRIFFLSRGFNANKMLDYLQNVTGKPDIIGQLQNQDYIVHKYFQDMSSKQKNEYNTFNWLLFVSWLMHNKLPVARKTFQFLFEMAPFRLLEQINLILEASHLNWIYLGNKKRAEYKDILLPAFSENSSEAAFLAMKLIFQQPPRKIMENYRWVCQFLYWQEGCELEDQQVLQYLYQWWKKSGINMVELALAIVENSDDSKDNENLRGKRYRLVDLIEADYPDLWHDAYKLKAPVIMQEIAEDHTSLDLPVYLAVKARQPGILSKIESILINSFRDDFEKVSGIREADRLRRYTEGSLEFETIQIPQGNRNVHSGSSTINKYICLLYKYRNTSPVFARYIIARIFATTGIDEIEDLLNWIILEKQSSIEELVNFLNDYEIDRKKIIKRISGKRILKRTAELFGKDNPLQSWLLNNR